MEYSVQEELRKEQERNEELHLALDEIIDKAADEAYDRLKGDKKDVVSYRAFVLGYVSAINENADKIFD